MTNEVYELQKSNILAGKQLGILSRHNAITRLARLENERARQAIEEAKEITLESRGYK